MDGINPFEVYLLLGVVVSGLAVLLGFADPTSVRKALPPLLLAMWAVLIASGGSAALADLWWHGNPFTAVEIRRVGLAAAGVGASVYGGAAFLLGPPGFAVAVLNLAFAAACASRIRQISRRLREVRNHLALVRGESGG